MKHLKTPLVLILVILAIGALAIAAGKLTAGRMQAVADVAPVEVAPWAVLAGSAVHGDVHATYTTLGTLESIAEVQVAGRFGGAILEMGPREGEHVEAGTLLARIDTEEFDAGMAAKQAELDAAIEERSRLDRELEREQSLLASGGSTQSKVDAAISAATTAHKRVEALEKALDADRTRRSYARVLSPVAGVVRSRMAEVGDLCTAYHPLYSIEADGAARLTLQLPQSLAPSIREGTHVDIVNGSETLSASLTRIHPELSPLALITADADLERLPFGLPSGARLEARLLLDTAPAATIVPRRALFGGDQAPRVLRIVGTEEESRVEQVEVHLRLAGDEGVAVMPLGDKSLAPGDKVVLGRPEQLAKFENGDIVLVTSERE